MRWAPIAGLAKKLEGKPVHFLYGNPWTWLEGVMEKIQPRLRTAGFAPDAPNFSAVDEITHPDVDRKELTKKRFDREKKEGLKFTASFILFDAHGNIAHTGSLTPKELEEWVAKLLKDAPSGGIDVGKRPYKEIAKLSAQIRAKKNLGAAARSLEDLREDKSLSKQKRAEVERLYGALRWYAGNTEASILRALSWDPDVAQARLARLVRELGKSQLGKDLKAGLAKSLTAEEWKAARDFRAARAAVEKIAPCDKCKSLSCASTCLSCEDCREAGKAELASAGKQLEALLKRHEDRKVAPAIRELLSKLK